MLGDKIKELRKRKKITQQKLAEIIGVSQSSIGMLEGNKQGASNETLVKLAIALDTTTDYLLSNDENKSIDTSIGLNKRDKKDISRALSETLEQLQENQDGLMFDGEPIDEETKELLRISLENSMRLAKQIAKNKFTPKKHKK
ncbi:helix-turn-helix domain-containing protein [Clostridium intestinale]|uniref:Immunity repressor protein n=1 Tax=Clostridium intestinale URNW TaxID=1294142 RepID=U2PZC9_9CLOT|nr:helix-turn-helix domain-containing protein [Clostridium intestinale]ERK31875.1 immunity repressor protein [Clostridium intestinale URNW]